MDAGVDRCETLVVETLAGLDFTERTLREARRLAEDAAIDLAVLELDAIRLELDRCDAECRTLDGVHTVLSSHLDAIAAVRDAGGAEHAVARLAHRAIDAAQEALVARREPLPSDA